MSESDYPRVAIIGTGTMGTAIAEHLLSVGFDVTVWNRNAQRAEALLDAGATVATSLGAAVGDADVVLVTVFDADAVLDVLAPIATALQPGAILVQCATIGTAGAQAVAEQASTLGINLIEAMMLGTKGPAEAGQLVLLAAGSNALIDKARPVLENMSFKIVVAGEQVGAGTRLKLACNTWIATLTAGTAQSLALMQGWGLDPHLFLAAIDGGQSDSPYAHIKGQLMLDAGLDPTGYQPAAFKVDGLKKDINLALAANQKASTRLLQALADSYQAASDAGASDCDIAAVRLAF